MIPDGRMIHVFSPDGRAALRRFIDRTTLLAFDLDGTLAPIVADPATIAIPEVINLRMARLCQLAKVIVLTGRGCDDARRYLRFTPHCIIGNHGAEGVPDWEKQKEEFIVRCRDWERQLCSLLPEASALGIVVENKGATMTLHYRNAPHGEVAQRDIMGAIRRLKPQPRTVSGKCVINIVPETAPHKGDALLLIMQQAGIGKAIFVGDDETDEDVFRLRDERIFGIRVGNRSPSAANFCLSDQQEIVRLLDELVFCLERVEGTRA